MLRIQHPDTAPAPLQHRSGEVSGILAVIEVLDIQAMDAIDLVHRHHHRTAFGSQDQHAWHDSPAALLGRQHFDAEQIGQRQSRHQRTAHVGHALQNTRALVRQGVDRLQWRDFRQARRGQGQPFFTQAEQQQ